MTFPVKDQSPHTSKWYYGSQVRALLAAQRLDNEVQEELTRIGQDFGSWSQIVSQLPHSINKVKADILLAFEQLFAKQSCQSITF